MDKISEAIIRQFEKHRVVFWYDTKQEMREEFEALGWPDVIKIELKGTEFGIKHRIMYQEPRGRFLLYQEGPRPDDRENWLLDVLLAEGEFRADKVSLWLAELGLGIEFWDLVQDHEAFFNSSSRLNALKENSST